MSTLSTTNIKHPSSGSNNIVLDSSARVLVGTSTSALEKVVIKGDGGGLQINRNDSGSPTSGQALGSIGFKGIVSANSNASAEVLIQAAADENHSGSTAGSRLEFHTKPSGIGPGSSPTERMRLDSSGNLKFNSGYGSVATAYGCRAWINFQGNGGYATRGSGNVSSFTEVGSGNGGVYNVNLTSSLPDTNGVILCSKTQSQPHGDIEGVATGSYVSASQLRVVTGDWDGTYVRTPHYAAAFVHVAVFR